METSMSCCVENVPLLFVFSFVPLLFSWAPQSVSVTTNLLAAFFPKTYSFYISQVKKGSLGHSSSATCQNQVNIEKYHCINQLMPRGEYCLEGGIAVNVQLAMLLGMFSPDFMLQQLGSTWGNSRIFRKNYFNPRTISKQIIDKNDNKTIQNNLRIENQIFTN